MCQNVALSQLCSLDPLPWAVGDELQVQLQPGLILILATLTPLEHNSLRAGKKQRLSKIMQCQGINSGVWAGKTQPLLGLIRKNKVWIDSQLLIWSAGETSGHGSATQSERGNTKTYQHASFGGFVLKGKIITAFRTEIIQGEEQPLHFQLQRCCSTSHWRDLASKSLGWKMGWKEEMFLTASAGSHLTTINCNSAFKRQDVSPSHFTGFIHYIIK